MIAYWILLSVLFLSFAFAAFNSMRKCIHMLQLNSYQYAGYFRTMLRIRSFFIPYFFICVFCFPIALIVENEYVALSVMSVLFVLFGLCRKPDKHAKKKLVYTSRVKRLLFTCILLIVSAAVGMFLLHNTEFARMIPIVFYALTAFIILLANIINTPIEKSINRFYINDAVRTLKASGASTIGVTGSYGKTSVKFYLSTLLREKYEVLHTPSSYNTPLGIVRTIRESMTPLHELFICEMGARHVGDIKEICDIVHPDCAVITSIGEQHLETFHTFDNIKKTKLELADAAENKGKGKIFINADSVTDAKTLPYTNIITYGTGADCDYRASDVSFSEQGMSFTVTAPSGESHEFTTRLLGKHNVQNVLGAIAVAHSYGSISLDDLYVRVMRIKPVEHRQELRRAGNSIIIDDAFNSNPQGAKSALETLSGFSGCRILITPGMVELGTRENELNHEFGRQAADVCDYVFLVGKIHTQSIYYGLKDKGFKDERITVTPNFKDAMMQANALHITDRKIILIENDLPDNY